MVNWLKVFTVFLLLLFFTALGLAIHNDISYSKIMPKAPNAATGQTNQISVNHGHIVFVSDAELRCRHLIQTFSVISICGFGLAVFFNMKYQLFRSK